MKTIEINSSTLPETGTPRGFRIAAKKLLLTYSQVPLKLSPEEVIDQLDRRIPIDRYVIGIEYHEDGNKHFHVVLIAKTRQDLRSTRAFNIEFEGETYRCNCQGIRYLAATVNYVTKEGSFITNMKIGEEGARSDIAQLLRDMSDKEGVEETLRYYDQNHPQLAMGGKSLLQVERTLKRRAELERSSLAVTKAALSTPYKVEDFKEIPKLEKWKKNGFQPTLILVGPAGCGKTQFVKALASENGWHMLLVNHKEALKNLSEAHDALFLDDISLDSIDEHTLLALLETNDDRTIRILRGTVHKRKGLVQMFAFNKLVFGQLRKVLQRREFARRCEVVRVPQEFIINVNVFKNCTITNHNNIYNNPETIKENQQALIEIANSPE